MGLSPVADRMKVQLKAGRVDRSRERIQRGRRQVRLPPQVLPHIRLEQRSGLRLDDAVDEQLGRTR